MDGWFLEMWFFASLDEEDIKVYNIDENLEETWPKSAVINFDPTKMSPNTFELSPIWLKPLKWNQGGYDAVYVDKEKNLVRFIQITRSDTHSFKIEYFKGFLENLKQIASEIKDRSLIEVKNLEIYFLVPKAKFRGFNFKYSTTTGQGGLATFGKGWEKDNEYKQVKVRGIQGFDQ
jgi:hypothetical protein